MDKIILSGVRTHNLKNIDLALPKNRLIVITGVSGSGKSSLAFDTVYAEGQRRYVESLSSYARQFLSIMEKPEVDAIEGLTPAIAIDQKTTSHNPRSTVGTVTEIYDYLRLLYARLGQPRCPTHQVVLSRQSISQIVEEVLAVPVETPLMLLAPIYAEKNQDATPVLLSLQQKGFTRVRINQKIYLLESLPVLSATQDCDIEVVVDRFRVRPALRQRIAESLEIAARISHNGCVTLLEGMGKIGDDSSEGSSQFTQCFSTQFVCTQCDYTLEKIDPRLFSFNSPVGACSACAGLGKVESFDIKKIVVSPEKSIEEGALLACVLTGPDGSARLKKILSYFASDLQVPWEKLTKASQLAILYGMPDSSVSIQSTAGEKGARAKGLLAYLEQEYKQTQSKRQRAFFARYRSGFLCPSCAGKRLSPSAMNVIFSGWTLPEMTEHSVSALLAFLQEITLQGSEKIIAENILKEVRERLTFLCDMGLGYLTLSRSADTLSGGESQRIRLSSQIGSALEGVIYVLDEPSIGLHERDTRRLLQTLCRLRDLGNTVIVVEHDAAMMLAADYLVDIGPGAGVHGGEVVAAGPTNKVIQNPASLTGRYLSGELAIRYPGKQLNPKPGQSITLQGAYAHNLKHITVDIPVGLLVCVTGVSGSGKSSLVNEVLYPAMALCLEKAHSEEEVTQEVSCADITGLEVFQKVIDINQRPIGRTPRSNPATYTQVFSEIRNLFAKTPEARARGYEVGRFSFNVIGGRCEVCQGDGVMRVEMHFLSDIYVTCDVCQGLRYNRETLDILYKGKNIAEVLSMTVEEATDFFSAIPPLFSKLNTLMDVGLSYITLGQNAVTLSGGEAQRLKLARELSRKTQGETLYILDEPTTGLHFEDIQHLMEVLFRLRDQGNTIVVIEHNMDVIKGADWIIDLGPEGGDAGGEVVATGTPNEIARILGSHTGQCLRDWL